MKKKALSLLLVLCMVFALFPIGAMAWDPADENYVDSGSYHDSGVTWVILEEDGENVLYIEGSGAMDGKEATDQYDYDREYRPRWDDAKDPWDSYSSTITKIVIGDGITSLGHNTFTGLRQVKEVVVGDGVTTIATHQDQKGEYGNTISAAFYQLSAMTKITLGAKVATVSPDMFKFCNDLKTIEISAQNPNMQLKDGIILDRTGTKVLMVPEGVLEHDYSDPTYPTLTIPEGVTALEDVSINSYYMGKLVLPSTLTKLDSSVFSSLGNLSEIEVAEGNNAFFTKDGILYSKNPVEIVLVPSKLSGEIELADGLTALPDDTFEYNSTITKITLPASLTDVSSKAITTMTGLQEVAVKEGNEKLSVENGLLIKTDGENKEVLFLNASYAGTVTIPEGVKEIAADVFGNNNSKRPLVTGLALPASLETIVNGGSVWSPQTPFTLLTNLETVTVADGNAHFVAESNVLYNADKTEIVGVPMQLAGDIVIPEGVTEIGSQFASHPNLTSISFPASLTTIGSNAFSGCDSIASFSVAEGSESFAAQDGILYDKDMTKFVAVPTAISGDIVIPDTVTSTANGYSSAFRNWSNVTSIQLPASLTKLENNTFQNCSSLKTITIPDGVTEIPYGAFEGCSSLETLYIPAGVTTIGSGYSARWYPAFDGCDSLKDIYFAGSKAQWDQISIGNADDIAFLAGEGVTVHFAVTTIDLTVANYTAGVGTVTVGEEASSEDHVFAVTPGEDVTLTVSAEQACAVGVLNADGSYDRLTATENEDGTYSFTIPASDSAISVIVGLKGDMNLSGDVNGADAAMIARTAAGTHENATAVQLFFGDVNGDGELTGADASMAARSAAGSLVLPW